MAFLASSLIAPYAALIAVAAITAMQGLGNQLKTTFNTTSSAMSTANS